MYACLAVTWHLHFWQNDRDFLRATVVTRGWNGYRNKSQHRKSTLEKKILPPFQQGFEPATFQSRVRCSNHWAKLSPPPIRGERLRHYVGRNQRPPPPPSPPDRGVGGGGGGGGLTWNDAELGRDVWLYRPHPATDTFKFILFSPLLFYFIFSNASVWLACWYVSPSWLTGRKKTTLL